MSKTDLYQSLHAPVPTQSQLTFCDGSLRDLTRWIESLPKANIGETARLLYQGLLELTQFVTPSDNRLQLLEQIRPQVYYVCRHLERHFLNQSIVLDERARKVANLCQALHNHLAVGYKQIIAQHSPRFGKESTTLVAMAMQRTQHCLANQLLRASQLYCPVPDCVWQELHEIHRLACQLGVQNLSIAEPLAHQVRQLTPAQTYGMALLLATSRCNQIRQNAIMRLSTVLESWSSWLRLSSDASHALFAVDTDSDDPPRYRNLFGLPVPEHLLGIDTHQLATEIQNYLALPPERRDQSKLPVPAGFGTELLQHLAAAWSHTSERSFPRLPGHGQLQVCIGMNAVHYYLSGEMSFAESLRQRSAPSAEASKRPATSHRLELHEPGALEEIQYHAEEVPGTAGKHHSRDFPLHELNVINHSPGGYCLAWPRMVASQLQAGEVVGLRDDHHPGWSLGVVRWIRQVKAGGTQMGIELIAPQAQPCGLQLVRESGEPTDFMRSLLLPEIRAIDIPASLLAPHLPFQEHQSVRINNRGLVQAAQLGRKRMGTGSVNQFEYRLLDVPSSGHKVSEDEFDTLWKSL